MRINYNVTGADRKALVRAMVELLGEPAVYQGAPSFAYAVGGYQVSKDGMVSFPEDTTPEDIRKLVDALREKGFQPVEPAELPTGWVYPRSRGKPAEDHRQQSAASQKGIGDRLAGSRFYR